jgi:hypothetical protein
MRGHCYALESLWFRFEEHVASCSPAGLALNLRSVAVLLISSRPIYCAPLSVLWTLYLIQESDISRPPWGGPRRCLGCPEKKSWPSEWDCAAFRSAPQRCCTTMLESAQIHLGCIFSDQRTSHVKCTVVCSWAPLNSHCLKRCLRCHFTLLTVPAHTPAGVPVRSICMSATGYSDLYNNKKRANNNDAYTRLFAAGTLWPPRGFLRLWGTQVSLYYSCWFLI